MFRPRRQSPKLDGGSERGGGGGNSGRPKCACPPVRQCGNSDEELPDVRRNRMSMTNAQRASRLELIVVGGYNGQNFDMEETRNMYKFNHAEQYWDFIGEMPAPRFHHCAVVHDPHIYIIGGASVNCTEISAMTGNDAQILSPTNTVYRYTPEKKEWAEMPPMATRRVYHTAVCAFGNIYVFGGQDEDQTILDSVEIYDIHKRVWSTGPSLRRPLMGAAAVVTGGAIMVSGGITTPTVLRGPTCDRFNVINRVHSLDVYTHTWSSVPSLPVPLVHHSALSINGEVLIVGGATAGYPKAEEAAKPHLLSRSDIFSFNAVTKMWELVATMPEARANCGAAVIGDEIVVAGGQGVKRQETLDSILRYDVYPHICGPGVAMPSRRVALALVAFPSFKVPPRPVVASKADMGTQLTLMHPQTTLAGWHQY
ncbi:hypothetical protein RvY_16992 [Ramazzottius varieornatus]|uniref:Uncharacterized protein n=1 Tax=Ramazzottius varieornatus TaxID=947166 RepID=A0A1D1W0J6_RAMVA|nr:hypothetical protein RvY_16992 [Ramazzottius varieornatus]